ncbi:MAG: hypothetical protein HYZ50_08205 [Deltaproteobacteria bacterium]|nr:hypothetical protein [Deltaproteobacteria bacterium]
MSTHVKPAPRPESLLGAWHTQVAATAKYSPWLVREMLRRKQELLPKFTAYYRQLRVLQRRTRRILQRKFAQSLAGAALLLALGQGHAIAATINVTTNVPDINADGQCSLIDAITAANTDSATGGCTAGSGADTISLPASSTHVLTADIGGGNGLPVISTEITIAGNNSTIQQDSAAPSFRLIEVTGNLTIQDTTLSGGIGYRGGCVLNAGTLTVTNSTISGNTADLSGGGVYNRAFGTFTVTNSTISGNMAVVYYGGGVNNNFLGVLTLIRSLVSGNVAPAGAEIRDFSGANDFSTVTVNNFNLLGHNELANAQAFSGFIPGATDLTATSNGSDPTALTDILDANLANNGGLTLTHALVTGSPAVNASPADADCPATDQRGVVRPQGAACDIGAFELTPEICGNCIDDDGDGKIDLLDDECQPAGPLTVSKGSFALKPDPNKDVISLIANFPSAGVTLDPPVDGVAISFFDADGSVECFAIPPNSAGWKVNKKRTTWSFKDAKDDSLGDPEADEKVIIKRNDKKGRYEITVNIKEAELIDPDAGLISSGLVIGDELRVNTQVWESAAKGKKLVTP